MGYMDNSIVNTDAEIILGKRDIILPYNSKWKIFKLNIFDKNGLWVKFKTKLINLSDNDQIKPIHEFEMYDYYIENPDIEFEVLFFNDIMQNHHLFKLGDKTFSYSLGKRTKRTKNIAYVRFYFDLNEVFSY